MRDKTQDAAKKREWYLAQLWGINVKRSGVMVEVRCATSVSGKRCGVLMGKVVRTQHGGMFVRAGRRDAALIWPEWMWKPEDRIIRRVEQREFRCLIGEPSPLSPWSVGSGVETQTFEHELSAICPEHGTCPIVELPLTQAYERAVLNLEKVEVLWPQRHMKTSSAARRV